MPIYLRQSTASQEIALGYFVSSTDGDTEVTGLTIANTDIKLFKSGATSLVNKNSGGGTHMANGLYSAVLDATDSDTIGSMLIFVHVATALPIRLECCVLDEAVFDVMFGTVKPQTTADAAPSVTGAVGSVATGGIAAASFASGAVDAAALAADAGTEIGTAVWASATRVLTANTNLNDLSAAGVRTAVGLASASLDTQLGDLPTNAELATALGTADDAVLAAIAAGVPVTAASVRAAVGLAAADLDTQLGALQTSADAILLDTDEMQGGIISGAAVTGTLSTTQVTTDLTGFDDNQLNGRVITFLSGVAAGEQRFVTDYASASGLVTFAALTIAPANSDEFKIT